MEERERAFRNRIYWFSFVLSVFVVWAHSFNAELFLGYTEEALRLERAERLLGGLLGQIAVPGFFASSGYLFYRGFCWQALLPKWRRRVRSLILPYLLWNLLYYLGYIIATRLPGLALIVGRPPAPVGGATLWRAVFLYGYNPVFWYLQQLILLTAAAPLLYPLLKHSGRAAAAFAFLLLLLAGNRDLPLINADALLYYCAGGASALLGGRLCTPRGSWRTAGLLLAAPFLIVWSGRPYGLLAGSVLPTVLLRLWGFCTLYFILRLLPLPPAPPWMRHTFLLYSVHFALVRLINKTAAHFLPPEAAAAFGLFLLMPFLALAATELLVRLLPPRLCALLTGGR